MLHNKVALVTGGSRGIGRAIALALSSQGASVAVGSRTGCENVAKELSQQGAPILSGLMNVRYELSVDEFTNQIENNLGTIDILVNNAGIYENHSIDGHCFDLWQQVLETNLTGAFLTCRRVLPGMKKKRWGRIINISSISGKVAEISAGAYSASKFGLIGLTQSLALEVADSGITVNAVCPGWVKTELAHTQFTQEDAQNQSRPMQAEEIARLSIPQMRFIEAADVAQLVVYLCLEQAKSITGQAINICGGSCM